MQYHSLEESPMPDILIRGLSTEALALLDERASAQGVSRNSLITTILSRELHERTPIERAELLAIRELVGDLGDPEIMRGAWR